MSEQGRKFDSGKLRYDLIPVLAQEEVVKVVTLGAEKYDPENWKRVPEGRRRYYAAAMRHMEAWRKGEKQDEIGTHHIANAISNLMFILEKELQGIEDTLQTTLEECESTFFDSGKEIAKLLDGNGGVWNGVAENSKDSYVVADKTDPLKPWYPDNSGEWIEYYGGGCPVSPAQVVEFLLRIEREEQCYDPQPSLAMDCDWSIEGLGGDIVAYKVCKD